MMTRSERRPQAKHLVTVEDSVLSIAQFCKMADISRPTFYRLRKQGIGPAVTRIGSRVLIHADTAANWLRAHEERAA